MTTTVSNLPPDPAPDPYPCLKRYESPRSSSHGELALFFEPNRAVVVHSVCEAYPVGYEYADVAGHSTADK